MGKIALAGFLGLIPVFNFVLLGYLTVFTRKALEDAEYHLPEWRNFSDLFSKGWRVFLLFMLFLSPLWLTIFIGISAIYIPYHQLTGEGLGYFGNWLLSIMAFILAFLIACVSSFLAPLAFFRWIESGELFWAVSPVELIADFQTMGWEYIQSILAAWGIFLILETFFTIIAVLLFSSPIWLTLGILFWIWSFISLRFLLWLFVIKTNAAAYSELRFRY